MAIFISSWHKKLLFKQKITIIFARDIVLSCMYMGWVSFFFNNTEFCAFTFDNFPNTKYSIYKIMSVSNVMSFIKVRIIFQKFLFQTGWPYPLTMSLVTDFATNSGLLSTHNDLKIHPYIHLVFMPRYGNHQKF